MVAARARSLYDKQAKARQVRKAPDSVQANLPEQKQTQARDAAGKAVGVSGGLAERGDDLDDLLDLFDAIVAVLERLGRLATEGRPPT